MLSVRGRATPGREAHGACRYLASVSRDGEPRMPRSNAPLRLDDWRCVRLWPASLRRTLPVHLDGYY
jgi:hypothetical protein